MFSDPIMSLKKAQRVQAFQQDGTETHAQDARWAFMARAKVTDKETPLDAEEKEQAEQLTLPWRALEAIQSAKASAASQAAAPHCTSQELHAIGLSVYAIGI